MLQEQLSYISMPAMNKKSLLWSLFLLLTLPTEAGAQESVQETIYEGTVKYRFDYPDTASGQESRFIPDTMTVFFRADSVKSVEETPFMKVTRIGTPGSLDKWILLEIPAQGKKLKLEQTQEASKRFHPRYPRLKTFTPTGKSKEILGCKAAQYLARDEESGKEYDVWFTQETILPRHHYTAFFPEKYGTPLEFTLPVGGRQVRVTMTGFTAEIQENGTFTVPGNFTSCNYRDFRVAYLRQTKQSGDTPFPSAGKPGGRNPNNNSTSYQRQ